MSRDILSEMTETLFAARRDGMKPIGWKLPQSIRRDLKVAPIDDARLQRPMQADQDMKALGLPIEWTHGGEEMLQVIHTNGRRETRPVLRPSVA